MSDNNFLGIKVQTVIESQKEIENKLKLVLDKINASVKINDFQIDNKAIERLQSLLKGLNSGQGINIPITNFTEVIKDIEQIKVNGKDMFQFSNGNLVESQKILDLLTVKTKNFSNEFDRITTVKNKDGLPIKQIEIQTDAYGRQIKTIKTLGGEETKVSETTTTNYKKQREELEKLIAKQQSLLVKDSKSAYSDMESLLKQEYNIKTQILIADEKENELLQQQLAKVKELQSTQAKNIVNNGLKNTDSISSYKGLNSQLSDKYELSVVQAKEKELKIQKELNQSIENYQQKMQTSIKNLNTVYGKFVPTNELKNFKTELESISKVSNMDEFTSKSKQLNNQLGQLTASSRSLKSEQYNLFNTLKNNVSKFMEFYAVGGLTVGFISAIRDGVKSITDMDSAIVDLSKVVNYSKSELNDMKNSALEMGKALGNSGSEVAKGMAEFGRVFKDAESIKEMTKTAIMASNVTDLSVEDASKSLNTAIISFGLNAKNSMQILDSWNEIQNNFRKIICGSKIFSN